MSPSRAIRYSRLIGCFLLILDRLLQRRNFFDELFAAIRESNALRQSVLSSLSLPKIIVMLGELCSGLFELCISIPSCF